MRSLHNFVTSLCVYMKIIQGVYTLLELYRSKYLQRGRVPWVQVPSRRGPKGRARCVYGFWGSGFCAGALLLGARSGRKLKSTPRAAFSFTVRCRSIWPSSTAFSPPYEVT
jgi:hypothetical protein